jgi:hypothetical protein
VSHSGLVGSLAALNNEYPTIAIVPTGWLPRVADIQPPVQCSSALVHVRPRLSLQHSQRTDSLVVQYVPFSLHSSFEELYAFVAGLRPRQLLSTVRGSHAALHEFFGALLDPTPAVRSVYRLQAHQSDVTVCTDDSSSTACCGGLDATCTAAANEAFGRGKACLAQAA